MSYRENLEVYHPLDVEKYLEVLKTEHGAIEHPAQRGSFLIGEPKLPFYKPQKTEDHAFILGFNWVPLSASLLKALVDHPELAPDETLIRWTEEQELIFEATLGDLRQRFSPKA